MKLRSTVLALACVVGCPDAQIFDCPPGGELHVGVEIMVCTFSTPDADIACPDELPHRVVGPTGNVACVNRAIPPTDLPGDACDALEACGTYLTEFIVPSCGLDIIDDAGGDPLTLGDGERILLKPTGTWICHTHPVGAEGDSTLGTLGELRSHVQAGPICGLYVDVGGAPVHLDRSRIITGPGSLRLYCNSFHDQRIDRGTFLRVRASRID